jgi:hypothetical protein
LDDDNEGSSIDGEQGGNVCRSHLSIIIIIIAVKVRLWVRFPRQYLFLYRAFGTSSHPDLCTAI